MSKTIDVDGGPRPLPDEPRGRRGSKRGGSESKPPTVVTIAAGVFGVVLVFGLLMAATGKLGVATIEPGEVGVKVNYITGTEEVLSEPGFKIFIPVAQEIFMFDKKTQEFLMAGDRFVSENHVPRLTVRADDGSNFWFEELRIQYELLPSEAVTVLNDSGPGEVFKDEWIKAHARSILRDEFGRYSAVQVADPTVYKQAPIQAAERMNKILMPHGIKVLRIITPNPKFDPQYELAIETRKEADQEVEELKARAEQLEQVREQRLAAVRKEKEVEQQELQGELIRALRSAERLAIELTRSADAYVIQRRGQADARKAELEFEAQGLAAKYTKEAEGIKARAEALEQRGSVVVREALIQKLAQIHFTLVPYSRDPMPQRLEHTGVTNAGLLINPSDSEGQ